MAGIIKGLVSDGTLPSSAKSNLATDITTPGSTVRAALKSASDTDVAALVQDTNTTTGSALSSRFALKGEVPQNTLTGVVSRTAPANPVAGMVWFDTSVPFVPDSLDGLSGLVARWRADDLAQSTGSTVGVVEPRSGTAAVNLTQPTAANQPTLIGEFSGGRKALQFTAAGSDFMSLSVPALDTPLTVFGVFDLDSALSYVYSGQNSANHVGMLTNTGGTTIRVNTSANLGGGVTHAWTAGDGPVVVAAVYTPGTTTARFYYNKLTAVAGTTNTAAQTGVGAMSIGRGPLDYPAAYSDLKLADLAFVAGSVDDATVKTVMGDLANYYGITLGA